MIQATKRHPTPFGRGKGTRKWAAAAIIEWPDLRRHFARVLEPLKAHAAGNVSGLDFTISVFGSARPRRFRRCAAL
jgi:hypothetical protein